VNEGSRKEMARIIILAQPSELFSFIEHALNQEGDFVRVVHDPAYAGSRINALLPDIIIVDAASPASATLEQYVRIRNRHAIRRTPILILGSAAQAGACGMSATEGITYLERPLQPASLITRVRVLLGSKVVDESKSQIVVADLVIAPASYQVTRSGRSLSVTLTEFRLLYYLASHPNTVCRRDRLRDLVSGSPPTAVYVHIRHLREKIEQDPKRPRLIRTVYKQGYRFHVPAESSSTLHE
jgi:DNA-binding response OmpR family regulator